MMCNGFYGKNFGLPVCSTCHLFLFSVDLKEDGEDGDNRVYNEVTLFCVQFYKVMKPHRKNILGNLRWESVI